MGLEDKKVLTAKGHFISMDKKRVVLTHNINMAYTFSQEEAEAMLKTYEYEVGTFLEIKPLLDYYTPFI